LADEDLHLLVSAGPLTFLDLRGPRVTKGGLPRYRAADRVAAVSGQLSQVRIEDLADLHAAFPRCNVRW
jgi:hypothetical protein